MKLTNLMDKSKNNNGDKILAPEQITEALGGAENATRILNALNALEAAGCFDNINFDDIVKGQ